MHVEGERRRRAPLGEDFVCERVIKKARAQPAPFFADRQGQEPVFAQAVIILDGMAGVAVMYRRPRSKIGRKLSAFVLQALLLGGELKIQTLGPPSPTWPVFLTATISDLCVIIAACRTDQMAPTPARLIPLVS
jgi:hypothetical protein